MEAVREGASSVNTYMLFSIFSLLINLYIQYVNFMGGEFNECLKVETWTGERVIAGAE